MHEWLNWIGHVARQNGCQPIFVLIPRNTDEEQKAILSVYEKLIRENSFLFIDVRTVARSLTGDDFGLAALYQDRSHPGELLSNAVADILAKFIANPDSFRYTKREVSALTKQFKTIAAANSESEHEIVSYKTSLMSMDCVRLRRGQTLQVRTGKFEKLQGISVNAAQCHQKVTLHGATEVVKDMSLRPFTKNPFEARVLPVDLPLRDLDGYVALSIAPADASVDDTSMETVPVSSTGPDHVEVGDLLLETGSRPMLYLAALPDMGTTDLVELVKLIQ